ncbi:dihydrofolate reductase family protein [Brachybacterium hainanense]|uniref:Dihydrofolate reductase family protein n=1 Tax=Brachybacterium hainanense TaxID=1541174 RepID=A0ABV6REJ4_9MICO
MHLLWKDGAPLPAPVVIGPGADGARQLAELYAPPPDRIHVRAMMNTTVDGAIAGADGISGSLRNPTDSFLFSVLRALCDVILVGARTVREEDYRRPQGREDLLLPSRRPGGASRPALAILTRSGDLPATVEADWPTYLLVPAQHRETIAARGIVPPAQVLVAEDAPEAVAALAGLGMRAIQAEGGPSVLGQLAARGILDELCFSVTHRTVGGPSPRVLDGIGHAQRWELSSLLVGEEATLTRYRRA